MEQIFLNGNEVIVDQKQPSQYVRMMRSYEDVKFRSTGVQRTLNEAIKMKNDISQQILKLREQTADNQTLSEKINGHIAEEHRLKELIKKQETDIKNAPVFKIAQAENLQKRHKQANQVRGASNVEPS